MKRAAIVLAGLAVASLLAAQLSKHKDWARSPEAYFLTAAEREEWSKIKTEEEAEKFIANYWAKRDPTPGTAANEFREGVARRIAAADEQFKTRRQKGSETVRGRLFVTLGSPSKVTQTRGTQEEPSTGGDAPPTEALGANTVVTQTWIYERDKFDPSWQVGELRLRITIDPQRGSEDLLTTPAANQAIAKVAEHSIFNPSGSGATATAGAPATTPVVPAVSGTGPAAAPAAAAPPPGAPAAIPAAVRSILEPLLKEAAPRKGEPSASFFGGPFRTATGEPFYAFQLYLAGDKAPTSPVKFGGVVTSDSGQEIVSYWEDAALSDIKSGARQDKVFEKSVAVPPGGYRAAFGLFPAAGGPALVSTSTTFRLEAKPTEFEVSPLILSNTLKALTKRPAPTDPFVFGVEKPIHVEPKGNLLFSKDEGLWYFYTVTNLTVPPASASSAPAAPPPPVSTPGAAAPAPTPAAPKPRVMTRLGVLRDGQPAFAPFSGPAELQPLAANYYGSGSEIPLATFPPGYYTLTLNLRDPNAPKDSAAFKGVDRQEDFVVLNPDGSLPPKTPPKPKTPAKKS